MAGYEVEKNQKNYWRI